MKEKFTQQTVLRMFYICGAVIFLIVGLANFVTNFLAWNFMIFSAKVSALFMNVFNFIISAFFFHLYNKSKVPKMEGLEEKDLEEIEQEVKNG